jgi:hypothetical protein
MSLWFSKSVLVIYHLYTACSRKLYSLQGKSQFFLMWFVAVHLNAVDYSVQPVSAATAMPSRLSADRRQPCALAWPSLLLCSSQPSSAVRDKRVAPAPSSDDPVGRPPESVGGVGSVVGLARDSCQRVAAAGGHAVEPSDRRPATHQTAGSTHRRTGPHAKSLRSRCSPIHCRGLSC